MSTSATSSSTGAAPGKFRAKRRRADQYHHGDLRRALIDAALYLIERHGPDGFTLREAARRVGVTHTAPYRHFKDKTELLQAVAVEGVMGMRDAMAAGMRDASDPVTALQNIGIAYVSFAASHPSHFRVMYSAQVDCDEGPLADAKREKLTMLVDAIRGCQAVGVFPPGPPERYAVVAWSHVHGLATLLIDGVLQRTHLSTSDPMTLAREVTGAVVEAFRQRARHSRDVP